jgi:sugar phosphate isomerase/epimerase
MRLAISNIAWDVTEDEQVAALLQQHGVDAIDIAPGKYFPQPRAATDAEIDRVAAWWGARGIAITGMQALLFGTTGLNVFGDAASQQAMLDHLDGVCRIAGRLSATRLVFGSPKARDRAGLDDTETDAVAVAFFRRLGDVAQQHGVTICLEPNPASYGCNFMTHSAEAGRMVALVAHPAIRMQLDTGAIAANGEDPETVIRENAPHIGHIHASEPELATLGDRQTDHRAIGALVGRYLPDHLVTIEMLGGSEAHPVAIARALEVAKQNYGAPYRH